jgi:O-antigen ligase
VPAQKKSARGAAALAKPKPGEAPAVGPAISLSAMLGLISLFIIPQAGGGYSGSGYQFGFVLLPLAAAIGVFSWPRLPRAALISCLLFLASQALMPFWLNTGDLLWYYLLQIPVAWIWTWCLLNAAPERARLILPVVTASAVLTALYGFFLWYGADRLDYQLSSSFGLHNAYGGYLLLAWPLAAIGALHSESLRGRALYFVATLILAATLVLTHSKGSIAAMGLQLLLLMALGLMLRSRSSGGVQENGGPKPGVPSLLPMGLGLLAVIGSLLALPGVRDALGQMLDFEGYSMQGRLRFWQAALEIFKAHPLAGSGPGSFAYVYPQFQRDWMYYSIDPHSWPLELLAELGLVGLAILLAVLWFSLRWAGKILLSPAGLAGALCVVAVTGSLAHAAFDFDYSFGAVTSLLGLTLALGSFMAKPKFETQPSEPTAAEGAAQTLRSEPDGDSSAKPGGAWKLANYALAALLGISLIGGELLTLERYLLDRVLEHKVQRELGRASADPAVERGLLLDALRYNPRNFETLYQLASLATLPPAGIEGVDRAKAYLDRAIQLNPRYAQAYALRGLLSGKEGEADLAKAVELDPYNFPEHYFYWATLAQNDEARRERLLLGMQRIPAHDPVPPDHIRPQWHALNPMFLQWWQELAKLSEEPQEKKLYQDRANRFKDYIVKQRERSLQAPQQ